jgi:hypothetical protein
VFWRMLVGLTIHIMVSNRRSAEVQFSRYKRREHQKHRIKKGIV